MGRFSIEPHEGGQDGEHENTHPIHGNDQGFVGTLQGILEVLVERLLRASRTLVLVEGEDRGRFVRDLLWSTFSSILFIGKLEFFPEVCDNVCEFFVQCGVHRCTAEL